MPFDRLRSLLRCRLSPRVALIAALAALCCACGQTGPLYLPDRGPQPVQTPPTQSDAETAESDSKRDEKRRAQETSASDMQAPVTPSDPAGPNQPPPGTP